MKGYRTLALNLLLAVAPVLQATNVADLGLSGTGATIYGAVVAGINLFLRFITTTPVGQKEPTP